MRTMGVLRVCLNTGLALSSAALALAQGLPTGGVTYLQTIPIPGWKATGAPGNANVDVLGFNPVTRIMYLADRTNHAIDVIDTHNNGVVAFIPMAANSVPNVPLVAIDLQQLVVSDGVKSVFVYDLRAPQSQPDTYIMPSTTPDGMDYDPINQVVYVITDDAPYYLVGISLPYKKIVTQTPLAYSADLIKFNPVDGKIYIATEDADNKNAAAGIQVYDPVSNSVTTTYKIGPACPGHGIDIDPVVNIAVMGCFGGTATGDVAVNLKDGTLMKTFTDEGGPGGGTDTVVFNPNNRRFYSGSGLNAATTSTCPKAFSTLPTKRTPIMGVTDVVNGPSLDGIVCTGGGHVAGVDPITNFIYVPVSQYPADPASASSGGNGVLVFRDNTPPAQAPVTSAQATLAPIGSGSTQATLQFSLAGRRMHVAATASNVAGMSAWLVIPTTVGIELAQCAVDTTGAKAYCGEDLVGDPMIGAPATLSVDGPAVSRGPLALPAAR